MVVEKAGKNHILLAIKILKLHLIGLIQTKCLDKAKQDELG